MTPDVAPDPVVQTTPAAHPLPSAPSVMRRALVLWGLGHLATGDRRGWLLVTLQVLGVVAIAALATTLLEGSRDIVVFLALVIYLVVWAGQAVDAQRRAVMLGAEPGGAIQILVLAPVAITALTVFWLVGGTAGSPAATLQRYVSAWRGGEPATARQLFLVPPDAATLSADWQRQTGYLEVRLEALKTTLGAATRFDARRPFDSLSFADVDAPPPAGPSRAGGDRPDSRAVIAIDVVQEVTVHGSFFGLFPTASQETVPVERVGTVTLRSVGQGSVLGFGRGVIWRIESVDLPSH